MKQLRRAETVGEFKQRSRCSHDAVIRIYDTARNVIKTQEHADELKEPETIFSLQIAVLAKRNFP